MTSLKQFLIVNSLFSALSGLSMLLFSSALNSFFNISNPYIFPILGVNLLVFSIIVAYVANRKLHDEILVKLISALDGLWVIGSVVIVLFGLFDLSRNGYILMSIVACWIGYLGYNQWVRANNNTQNN